MKIRNGFVSNSSSSSFIIAIAEVMNEDALREFLTSNKIDAKIESDDDFIGSSYNGCRVTNNAKLRGDEKYIQVESFDGSDVSLIYDKTKKYLTYYNCIDSECNDDGETIYNDFVEDDAVLKLSDHKELVNNFKYTTGCGRNG